jgi:uncharacterized lipoprotein YddW (UPF0748 family)
MASKKRQLYICCCNAMHCRFSIRSNHASMHLMIHYLSIVLIMLFPLTGLGQGKAPKHEFRGVWVATVENIDWPSEPGLTVTKQQAEVIEILDMHQKNGMNAIILQVRPASDALYPSALEPWSKYLTGYPGKAPEPFYDPLKFWIEECHNRGMELHAWLNPYRVALDYRQPIAGNHIAFQHPEWILRYGERLYFDPGLPETRNFVTRVVADLVKRYDLDAIHFDDYFYPYPLETAFPDTASFRKYNRAWPEQYKADWRRENVDILIQQISKTIKQIKPWVKFGISPFGVWRNKKDDPRGSETQAEITNFDHLYANVIKWQEKGWIDYLLPQLYWQTKHPSVDFEHLVDWWEKHSYDRGMYIGHGIYKIDSASTIPEWTLSKEMPRQIHAVRASKKIDGSAFYSSIHFNRNLLGFQDSLQKKLYQKPALVPPMKWIDSIPPPVPGKPGKWFKRIHWKVPEKRNETDKPVRFAIYLNKEGTPPNTDTIFAVCSKTIYQFKRMNRKRKRYEVRISALDRLNNESKTTKPIILKL